MNTAHAHPDEATLAVPDHADVATRGGVVSDCLQLTKPRITLLVVLTAGVGFMFGVPHVPGWSWWTLIGTLLGVALSCMGASAFNQAYEAQTDAMMRRTRSRPLPQGRRSRREAVALGAALSILGIALLAIAANAAAAGLAAFTILSYTLAYTPLKRVTPWALLVGAIPGAMPPTIGYAAATGHLGPAAATLFALMFVWQVPHFLAIAYLYKEDYAAAGLAMWVVRDPSGRRAMTHTVAWSTLLTALGVLPWAWGVTGPWAAGVAVVLGGVMLWLAVRLARTPSRAAARHLFLSSLVYLPLVLAAMVVDRA